MKSLVVPTPRRTAVRVWRYLLAAPVVAIMARALVVDLRRIGEVSKASEMPAGEFSAVEGAVASLLIGVWALSELRSRTPVLVLQVLVVWIGGMLHLTGVRVEVSWWDVAEEAFLLTATLLLALPRARGTAPRRGPVPAVHRRAGAPVDGVCCDPAAPPRSGLDSGSGR